MTEIQSKNFSPVKLMVLVFVLINSFFLVLKNYLAQSDVNSTIAIIGNLILFIVGLFTLKNALRSIANPNPHVFVRVFYTGFIIRLFTFAIAAFAYIYWNDGKVSKPTLFACLGIYVLYSAIEVISLKKALRENKNGK